jgi:hypothetical protein
MAGWTGDREKQFKEKVGRETAFLFSKKNKESQFRDISFRGTGEGAGW